MAPVSRRVPLLVLLTIALAGCATTAALRSGERAELAQDYDQAVVDYTRALQANAGSPAARQGLEGCAGCHTQSSCTQCHSARLGWRISPHGPGFDAERLRQANPLTCRLCHPGGAQP